MRIPVLILILIFDVFGTRIVREKFVWKQLDFEFETNSIRQQLIDNGEFIQRNNIPFGIEVWRNKMFISVPRRNPGIPSTLNYVDLNDINSTTIASPLLKPYPDLKSNEIKTGSLISVYRMNVDICNRLWLVDTGTAIDNNRTSKSYQNPSINIYDLKTNYQIQKHYLKDEDLKQDSSLVNIIVDIDSPNTCNDAYAYISDLGAYGLIVFNLKSKTSWRIQHSYFYPSPLDTDYNIGGVNFQWLDGIFGLALSGKKSDGFRNLYFHPLSSNCEFSVSTKYLKNSSIANSSFKNYKILGCRGPHNQASGSSYDEQFGILFYPLVNKNALAYWNENRFPNEHSSATNIIFDSDNVTLIYSSDLKIDKNSNLWTISNRIPIRIYGFLDPNDFNFRILYSPVKDIVQQMECRTKKCRQSYHEFSDPTVYY